MHLRRPDSSYFPWIFGRNKRNPVSQGAPPPATLNLGLVSGNQVLVFVVPLNALPVQRHWHRRGALTAVHTYFQRANCTALSGNLRVPASWGVCVCVYVCFNPFRVSGVGLSRTYAPPAPLKPVWDLRPTVRSVSHHLEAGGRQPQS